MQEKQRQTSKTDLQTHKSYQNTWFRFITLKIKLITSYLHIQIVSGTRNRMINNHHLNISSDSKIF